MMNKKLARTLIHAVEHATLPSEEALLPLGVAQRRGIVAKVSRRKKRVGRLHTALLEQHPRCREGVVLISERGSYLVTHSGIQGPYQTVSVGS